MFKFGKMFESNKVETQEPTKEVKLQELKAFIDERVNEWRGSGFSESPKKTYFPEGANDVAFGEALREVEIGKPEKLKNLFDQMISAGRRSVDIVANNPIMQDDVEKMQKLREYLDDFDQTN